ncbi:uncharacterized protein LOC110069387 [Orbicella faveolata]|uniref:uncharacterized protein LOC110069387 n=1 Tax=Orbicella faveolata TaxID=48498 RepID=UPI0009E58B45|nr:uncharacterized protein LOC110069387 [Orbicella faveolata]XP_020632570.1 uncharacterized protein LOC110069387 [Orbicella faveolata]
MREDGDLGATNPRINRWLEGVETAINEGTLYGREEDKSEVWTGFRRKSVPSLSINHQLRTDGIRDNNHHIEWLDLDSSRVCYFPPQNFTAKDKSTALILPEIPSQATQKYPRSTKNRLEVIDLEYKVETELMKKDTRMESANNPMDDDKCDCQVSITEGVNLLSFNQHNNNDEEELTDDHFSKSALITKWRGSTGSVDNNRDQLTITETTTNDMRYETITNHVRADTQPSREKGKFSLPPLKNNEGRRHTVHEVPSITVCQDGEIRVGKDAEDSIFDPRFLMPTEVSLVI